MSPARNPGRVVGFWYLLLVLGGPLRLIYIPNKLFVHDNAAATAGNIAAHELLFRFGMLSDLFGAVVLSVFDKPQRDALVLLFLRLHHAQIVAAEILWGLWLFPMGALAYKSRFLPRFIGVWLIINGVAYIVLSLTGLFFPDYQDKVFAYSQPALFGELAIMLWLVIKGASPPEPLAART